jgi:signal peptidase II
MTEIRGQRSEVRSQKAADAPTARPPSCAFGCSLSGLRAALPDRTAHLIFWPIAILGLAADLWTKAAVFAAIRPMGSSRSIIDGFLTFRPVLNDGAAFGIAAGRQPLLVGVSLAALIVIIGIFLVGCMRSRTGQAALGMFVAGVCGNLWDRLFNDGYVRDFVDVVYWPGPGHHWNTFNVADSLLCVAVVLLVLASFLTPAKPSQTPAPPQK